jgi:sentrin-specific protease 1
VIFMAKKEIHYYDSMSGSGAKYLEGMKKWLQDEYRDKKKEDLNVENWILKDKEKNVPQQRNGVDCGMFSIICADFLSDDLPLAYEQKDMPTFREKVAAAVLAGKLDYPL